MAVNVQYIDINILSSSLLALQNIHLSLSRALAARDSILDFSLSLSVSLLAKPNCHSAFLVYLESVLYVCVVMIDDARKPPCLTGSVPMQPATSTPQERYSTSKQSASKQSIVQHDPPPPHDKNKDMQMLYYREVNILVFIH
jgi:hypothetical protein